MMTSWTCKRQSCEKLPFLCQKGMVEISLIFQGQWLLEEVKMLHRLVALHALVYAKYCSFLNIKNAKPGTQTDQFKSATFVLGNTGMGFFSPSCLVWATWEQVITIMVHSFSFNRDELENNCNRQTCGSNQNA